MTDAIKVSDVYDKNLNFLIGSGASYGLFPTLALKLKNDLGEPQTIETLAARFEDASDSRRTPLFMHYYETCIRPAQQFTSDQASGDPTKQSVLKNYETFMGTVLNILQRRKPFERRCNIFTTNYDGCFSLTTDSLLESSSIDFVLNDGARGFTNRFLQSRNFNSYLCQTGIFERHASGIPQINLIHLHGSVYWQRRNGNILVDYQRSSHPALLTPSMQASLRGFSDALMDESLTIDDLNDVVFGAAEKDAFWESYKQLPIVNPTKWKFHETVFEEHYYQMLRALSYELEKPNAVLITFGFSFADEHITSLIKRSLSNPKLQVFICCFNANDFVRLSKEFRTYPNVTFVQSTTGILDFSEFNESVFNITNTTASATAEIPQ